MLFICLSQVFVWGTWAAEVRRLNFLVDIRNWAEEQTVICKFFIVGFFQLQLRPSWSRGTECCNNFSKKYLYVNLQIPVIYFICIGT